MALALCLILLCAPAPAVARSQGPQTISPVISSGSEIWYPPFCFADDEGRADGFAVELLKAALAAMGRDVSFRTGPWSEVRGWLERGEVQALPLVGRTPEREPVFDFTFPYMTLHGAIVVRKGTTGIWNLKDLKGRSVAVMRGDNAEEFLRREDRGMEIHVTTTFEEALNQLSEGHYDAVVVQRLVGMRLIKESGLRNLQIVKNPIEGFSQDFCFAVREGDRQTLALLNEGLALVMADGTYRHLHAKWFAALELPTHKRFVIGGDDNYPPFEYLDRAGRPAGYNVDLTRAIAREIGLDVEIRLGPWAQTREALAKGEIDAIEGMLYSTRRDLTFDFTPPHTVNHYVGVVRKNEGPLPVNVDDLAGRRIVVEQGDIMHDFLLENGLGNQSSFVPNQEVALRELANGKFDCALVTRLSALYWIKKHGWKNLDVGRRSLLSAGYCFAVHKNHKALLSQLSEGLKILDENGEYRRIYDKWMGVYKDSSMRLAAVLRYVAAVTTPLIVLVLAFFLWSWSLHKQVALKTSELQRSYEFQEAMIDCSPVALYSVDRQRRVLTWNASAERIFGWTDREVVGKLLPIVPDDRRAEFDDLFKRLNSGQVFVGVEVVRRRKDGALFDGSLSAAPIRDADGKMIGILGALEDITQRKQIEKAIEASEKKFRQAIEQAPFPIMIYAEDGQVLELSRAWTEITGYAPSDIPTITDWIALARGKESEKVRAVVGETFHPENNGASAVYEIICRDGSRRVWDFSSTPLGPMPDGRRVVIGMAADITEIRHAQERIQHLNRILRAIRGVNQLIVHERNPETLIRECCKLIVNNRGYASALVVLTDDDDRPVLWARAGLAASSRSLESMLETGELPPCCNTVRRAASNMPASAKLAACDKCAIASARECADTQVLCVPLIHDASSFGYLAAVTEFELSADQEEISLFKEMAGDLAYALNALKTDEARKNSENQRASLQNQLIQAQKMESIGRLAGGVAHDYNNMLSVILGHAELALERVMDDESLRADIAQIHTAAQRSADITRQLLAFARQQTVAPKVLDLNRTVGGMLGVLRRLIGENIDLSWRPKSDIWTVKIDPTQIHQIVANLCVNARDAIADVGNIAIETNTAVLDDSYCDEHAGFVVGEYVTLTVSDSGSGMDKETLDKIFEPFFTTKDAGNGTGLGLATVYGIVKQNEGFINVYSEPGQGATFKVYFPRYDGQPVEIRDPSSADVPMGQGETVLVVEDDTSILSLTEQMLGSLNYKALLADHPSRARRLEEMHAGEISLLITDVVMPEMNGRELSRQLQARNPDLKCLFMSGYTAEVIAHRGILDEGVNFIQKPFSRMDLAISVRAALDQ